MRELPVSLALRRLREQNGEASKGIIQWRKVGVKRRPHLPCPSQWIAAPGMIMATTSQCEAA
jgi:hypothetical protein